MSSLNQEINSAILEIVDAQIRDLDPPETRKTYDRLVEEGYTAVDARKLIGYVLAMEMYEVLKSNGPFNEERFITALQALPYLPQ